MFEVSDGGTIHVVGSIRVPSRHRRSLEFQAKTTDDLKRILTKRLTHGLRLFQNGTAIRLDDVQKKLNRGQTKDDAIELLVYKAFRRNGKTTQLKTMLSKEAEDLMIDILPGHPPAVTKDGYVIVKKKWTRKLRRGENLSWSYSDEKR